MEEAISPAPPPPNVTHGRSSPTPLSLSSHTGERHPLCPHPYPHAWERWSPPHTHRGKWLHSSSSQRLMSDVRPRFWNPNTFIHSTHISGWPLMPTAALRVGSMNSAATFAWALLYLLQESNIYCITMLKAHLPPSFDSAPWSTYGPGHRTETWTHLMRFSRDCSFTLISEGSKGQLF